MKVAVASKRLQTISSLLEQHKEPSFRLKQICNSIYNKKVPELTKIASIPQKLKDDLVKTFQTDKILSFEVADLQKSAQATKALFKLHDGEKVESVFMKFQNGHTSLCISSQVGCALKCNFCATGAVGFKRQMTPDEITDQVLYFQQQGEKVDSISFMGMGEPLMNPKVFDAIEILTNENLFNMPERKLSVSTVGVIPGIEKLGEKYPHVNLAFSLHSPFPEQRNVLVPTNKIYPLVDVMKALEAHAKKTNRKIFLAYLVLDGYNDSLEHSKAIRSLIGNIDSSVRYLFHMNLLRYNPAEGIDEPYKRTEEDNIQRFAKLLSDANISVTARQSFGVDIDAACGQLYASYQTAIHKNAAKLKASKQTQNNQT